ncbi:MAG: HDIG domain-containing protein [Firmicutes bacterium]|nr:HDIG domain-containing protein [Bacillota bacterium]MCM1402023.1 HDIG domain-containing protein [Bacteroides sp.]MCM1477952.1 HDIG domain-containing protein [Bacteroides sp.]
MNPYQIIDKYYPAGTPLRDIYLRHCRSVANEALEIAHRKHLPLTDEMIEGAALTHDIGIFATNAPSIQCRGTEPYIAHGVIGAALLRREGAPEEWARVAERHTGSGLIQDEITCRRLPLPPGNYVPESLLERLICYADKFYSKSGGMKRKNLEQVRKSMAKFGQKSLDRFEELHSEFA